MITVTAITFDMILFVVIFYVGTKINWFGEIEKSPNKTMGIMVKTLNQIYF